MEVEAEIEVIEVEEVVELPEAQGREVTENEFRKYKYREN
jgi:hypothetical protein